MGNFWKISIRPYIEKANKLKIVATEKSSRWMSPGEQSCE